LKVSSARHMSELPKEYALVVAEKPDAARRIAMALGRSSSKVEDHAEYILCLGTTNYAIAPAVGHIFSLAPAYPKRDIHPVLDLKWVPLSAVDKRRKDADRRIRVFRSLSKKASKLIVACDFDTEGDTIGYNILKYACGLGEVEAYRAKFSTLTEGELAESFSKLTWQDHWPMAEAGRTRHLLDFVWGINLSRALTDSLLNAGGNYMTLSIGRVQGPTIHYVYEREVEIRGHVPVPYWQAEALIDANGNRFHANYSARRIDTETEAMIIRKEVEGKEGIVIQAIKSEFTSSPPPSFNLGDLQHEAFRIFSLSPSQTLSIAEKLYLQAAISYPRTSSQQIPVSIGWEHILKALTMQGSLESAALSVIGGKLSPIQGKKTDPAHPAIFPTGEPPHNLEPKEQRLYELIARRFISSFSEGEIKERYSLEIRCGKHFFHASTVNIKSAGWSAIYNFDNDRHIPSLPSVSEGTKVIFVNVDVTRTSVSPPPRYNQNTLLERMENDNIGTKATRAEVISTLVERGYISGGSLELSDLGFAVVETMSKYSPSILSVEMTRSIEAKLEAVEAGQDSGAVAVAGVDQLMSCLRNLERSEPKVGAAMRLAANDTLRAKATLGSCPICHDGQLMIIRSRKTGKRFVGCNRYRNGCRASAPLPQNGVVRATHNPCKTCGWPVVLVFASYGKRPWRLCVNPGCPAKRVPAEGKVQGSLVD